MSRLVRNSISYIFIGFLPVAANFFLAPVYANYLAPREYAIIGVSTIFQTFLSFFLSLSFDGAFNRLYFDYEKSRKLSHALLSTLLLSILFSSLIVYIVLALYGNAMLSLFFSNDQFRFTNLGWWVLLTTLANIIFTLFSIYYRNQERIKAFTVLSITFFFLPVAGTLTGLIYLNKGAAGSIIGRSIGSMAVIFVLLGQFYFKKPFVFKWKYFRKGLRYSLPLIPYQLMFAAFANIDRIFLERNFLPATFGIYNFAALISGLVPVFINALNNAVYPRIFRALANKGNTTQIRSINYISLFVLEGVICLAVACIVPMMRLFISDEYAASYNYIATLFLSYIPYLHYLIFTIPLFFEGKTKVFPVISFFALASGILFNLFFIPYLGLWAVCLSLYVIRIVQFLVVYVYARQGRFSELNYIRHGNAMTGSFFILFVYNLILWANQQYQFFPIDIINLIPLLIFLVLFFSIYKKEVDQVFDISRVKAIFGR